MVERERWMKPKVQYIDRKCTLCNDNDIQDEYHIVLKCNLNQLVSFQCISDIESPYAIKYTYN